MQKLLAAILASVIALWLSPASAGPGIDQFEMKDLDSEPGAFQFQSQNAFSSGFERRRVVETAPGAFAFDDNPATRERLALEMQMGITSWFRARLGVEFEKGKLDDPGVPSRADAFGDLQLSSVALEGVFVLKPVKGDGFGLGLLTEFDSATREGGKQLYIGPILQAVRGPWSGLANLLLVQHFGSPDRFHELPADRSLDFAYALQLQYEISPTWSVALEGYGTLDRISAPGNQAEALALFGRFDQHRAGPVVYYRFDPSPAPAAGKAGGPVKGLRMDQDDDGTGGGKGGEKETSVSIGVGVLFGLNANTPDETLKLSLEYNW